MRRRILSIWGGGGPLGSGVKSGFQNVRAVSCRVAFAKLLKTSFPHLNRSKMITGTLETVVVKLKH